MKQIITGLLAFLFSFSHAQSEKSLLWKISEKGIEKPSYLFGTIHASCDSVMDNSVVKAMKATQQLYLEIDMDDPALQMSMMSGMNMKGGKKISDLVNKDDYAVLDTFLQDNIGIPLQMLNTIKPFFVSAMFLPKLLDCKMQSIEEHLMKISKQEKEPIFGLETVKEQMDVFDAIPYQEQVDALLKSAKDNLASDKKEFKEMQEIYNSKDLTAMLQFNAASENEMFSKYEDELLNNRNKNWIPKIEKVIQEKPTFFGVGAAHLGGENGVISLLRKQGYKVEAVL